MIPDLSQFQGAVNWDALEAAYRSGQMEAVILRAGWGSGGLDAQFPRNWSEARRRGIKRIAYWFCYPSYNSPEAEAAAFNSAVGPLQPNEGMAGDFEHDAGNWPPHGLSSYDWASRFLTLTGGRDYVPGWYAPPSFIREQAIAGLADVWWLWVANWFVSSPDTVGKSAGLWQFTDRGNFAGISTVDLSYPLVPIDRLLTGGDGGFLMALSDQQQAQVLADGEYARAYIDQNLDPLLRDVQAKVAEVHAIWSYITQQGDPQFKQLQAELVELLSKVTKLASGAGGTVVLDDVTKAELDAMKAALEDVHTHFNLVFK